MKENKLANTLDISLEAAVQLMEKYMGTYPAVQAYFSDTQATLEQYGCVYSLLGRVRSLPEVASPVKFHRWRAGRQGANFQIQASAAECAKMAMIELFDQNLHGKTGWTILSQVHDEILLEGPKETATEAAALLKKCMEDPFRRFGYRLRVQLKAAPTIADSWQDAK